MLKVENYNDLRKDPYSKGIININEEALLSHRKHKNFVKQNMENNAKIVFLEKELSEIKKMLAAILTNTTSNKSTP